MATVTITPATIIPAKIAENAQTTQYTSTGLKTLIDKFTTRNYSGGAVTFAVNLVTLADTAGNQNLIVSRTLQAGETYTWPEIVGTELDAGDFISTIAGAATSVNLRASGRKVT